MVVGFFRDVASDEAKAYMDAAANKDAEFIMFGIVTSKEVAESLGTSFDSVVVFKKFDEGRATMNKLLRTF